MTTGWLTVYAECDSHFKVRAQKVWKIELKNLLVFKLDAIPSPHPSTSTCLHSQRNPVGAFPTDYASGIH